MQNTPQLLKQSFLAGKVFRNGLQSITTTSYFDEKIGLCEVV
jgi:hypothetical protein